MVKDGVAEYDQRTVFEPTAWSGGIVQVRLAFERAILASFGAGSLKSLDFKSGLRAARHALHIQIARKPRVFLDVVKPEFGAAAH
jgi:hypothetical protein